MSLLHTILGSVVGLGVVLLTVLNIPVFIFRLLAIKLAKWLRQSDLGDIVDPISALIANDLFTKRTPRSNIITLQTFEGHLTLEEVKDAVGRLWINAVHKETGEALYEKFKQYPYQWLGFLFWRNDDCFHIDNHVYCHPNLGRRETVSEVELSQLTEKLLNAPHPPERSPWEIHIVQNYYNSDLCQEQMTVVVSKIHHCVADGYSLQTAFVEGLCEIPIDERSLPQPRYLERSYIQNLVRYVCAPITGFYGMSASWFGNIFMDSPLKVPNSKKSWHQIYGRSKIVPTQQIKDIKNAFGVSFTSVLLSAISAGISQYCETKRKEGSWEADVETIPFVSMLPLPRHSRRLTNHIAGILFELPCPKNSHPLRRLHLCHEHLESKKQSIIPTVAKFYFDILGRNLAQATSLVTQRNRVAAAGLTNFPMSKEVYFNGKKCIAADFAAGCLEGEIGMAFMVGSYSNSIRFAITGENAILKRENVAELTAVIEKEIDVLHALAQTSSSQDKIEFESSGSVNKLRPYIQ